MKIKFLDATTPQEYYAIDEGCVYTKCKNETLDSATISISNTTDILELEALDRVVLVDEEGRFDNIYLCIDTIDRTDICITPKIYKYDIQLISETKILEGIRLPDKTYTPSATRKTVYEVIYQYMELYCPKIRVSSGGLSGWINEISLDSSIEEIFDSVECPEMQWNTPTLREVLNDLMMVKDRIPVVRNNVLYSMDLTEINRDISNDTHINYVHQSKSLEDYVSELKMNLVNGMQENKPDVNSVVRRIEYAPFTAEGDYIVSTQNMVVKTQFPILRIISLKMAFGYSITKQVVPGYEYEWEVGAYTEDLCNFDGRNGVYEEKEYRTLPKLISDDLINSNLNINNYGNYQNLSVYYSRGSNVIGGFSNLTEQRLGWISEKYDTTTILKDLIMRYRFSNSTFKLNAGDFQNTFFIIEYETIASSVFSASKSDYPKHKRTVVDNQTNSYTNVYKQGFLEYQKANRLGNLSKMINARYDNNYTNLITIGDIYNNSIVYQCQYQFYKNHIEINAQATENYVLRDYFTGVKAKLRSWKIVDGSEAHTRHELVKYYCELSYEQYTEIGLISNSDLEGITLNDDCDFAYQFTRCLETIANNDVDEQMVTYCGIKFSTKDGFYPSGNNKIYLLEVLPQIVGNSLLFTFGCNDNYGIEKVAELDYGYVTFPTTGDNHGFPKLKSGIGGIPLKDLKYVDTDGECVRASLVFTNRHVKNEIMNRRYQWQHDEPLPVDVFVTDEQIAASYRSFYEQNLDSAPTEPPFFDKVTIYKDNKEILKWSYQFEFCSSTKEITIGKAFLTRQPLIHNGALGNYKVYSRGVVVATSYNVYITNIDKSCCRIAIGFDITVPADSLVEVIDDATGELIFSFIKKGLGSAQVLYLNFLKDRDKTVHNE